MNEVLIEHPILFIENLLRLGIGDEGRLIYLRNAMTKGTNIHNSDKKFLKKMQLKFNEVEFTKSERPFDKFLSDHSKEESNTLSENAFQFSNREANRPKEKNTKSSAADSGILKIQNQIAELKKNDSKLMDNLELLYMSHEMSS